MRFVIEDSCEALSRAAAAHFVDSLRQKPSLSCILPTGSTPTRTYELLAEARSESPALFDRVTVIKLDEWGGLAMDDPATCEVYLREYVLGPLGVTTDRYLGFSSDSGDAAAECRRVRDELARREPVDICLLGLGLNGHLGLNEPGEELEPHAHVAELSETSLTHPMLTSARAPVDHGLTLGIADILVAREIVLLVSGAQKREPLARLSTGRVSTALPASFLWLHPNVTCFCDRDAADGIDLGSRR